MYLFIKLKMDFLIVGCLFRSADDNYPMMMMCRQPLTIDVSVCAANLLLLLFCYKSSQNFVIKKYFHIKYLF